MADSAEVSARNSLYETDFYEWTQEQARLLRSKQWRALDLENLIDEVETVGRSNKQEIRNRLAIVLEHLLKWEYQPEKRKYGWRVTLREQRGAIDGVIEDSPSLCDQPALLLQRAYRLARIRAASDTGLAEETFPDECPFMIEDILSDNFYPGPPEAEIV